MNSWIEISKNAVINNINIFKNILGTSELALVLKSNAYGHGLAEIYSIIKDQSIPNIAVAYLEEALYLRSQGYKGSIFMLTPIFKEELDQAYSLNVEVIIGSFSFLKDWIQSSKRPKAHIKIDSGLSRQGFCLDSVEKLSDVIIENNVQKDLVGVFTHFANVEDVLEQDYANQQIKIFNEATSILEKKGIHLKKHAAASSAILLLEDARFDMDRLGISLYGLWPSNLTRISYLQSFKDILDLQPVLSWRSKISSIKSVKAGVFVGYGCSYRTVKDTLIGVIPVGYYDGYRRAIGETKSYVLVRGQRAPLIGRVSMNLITVDLSNIEGVSENDIVTLIGEDGSEFISASCFAEWAGTIHYEVLSGLNPKIKRIIV